MTWAKRAPKWNWRVCLTKEEEAIVKRTDAILSRCRRDAAEASAQRILIVNRAIHRAKYQAGAQ